MGRGLSELQKTMLRMAQDELDEFHKARDKLSADPMLMAEWHRVYADHLRPVPEKFAVMAKDNWMGYVYLRDVFVKVYGWPDTGTVGEGMFSHPRNFPKKDIGQKRYMAAYIAVRKSIQRLVNRDLIHVAPNGSSYYLTDKGKDILLAKLPEAVTPYTEDNTVELRYLRDIVVDGKLMHPKGEIIEVEKENAKRMLVTDIWGVVNTRGGEKGIKGILAKLGQ